MASSYGTDPPPPHHQRDRLQPPAGTAVAWVLALPVAVAVGVVLAASGARGHLPTRTALLVLAGVLTVVGAAVRTRGGAVLVGLVLVGGVVGHRAWSALDDTRSLEVDVRAVVMSDPVRRGGAVDVVLEVEGRRYQAWLRGSPARRLADALRGDTVRIAGRLEPVTPLPGWYVARHVVGEIEVERASALRPGPPLHESANRLRRRLDDGARPLPEADRALWAGLVYGDDRAVDPEVVEQFRSAGMSHLTAVSGQNIAYLLVAAGPLLRRLSPMVRWLGTVALVGWLPSSPGWSRRYCEPP